MASINRNKGTRTWLKAVRSSTRSSKRGPSNEGSKRGSKNDGSKDPKTEAGKKTREPGTRISDVAKSPGALKKMMDTRAMSRGFNQRAQAAITKMKLYNVFNMLLWQVKALAIMLVGVGVKLAIYKPAASPHKHYALQQRVELGLSAAAVFFVHRDGSHRARSRHCNRALFPLWRVACVWLACGALIAHSSHCGAWPVCGLRVVH
jgi:hypothetical protein